MNGDKRVLIAIPVRNGGRLLERCLLSALGQSHENLEVAVFDNNSTDQTREICERYCAKNQRLKIFRCDEDLPILENFQRAWDYASTAFDFFMLLPHDDFISPNFVSIGVESLNKNSEALSVAPKVFFSNAGKLTTYPFNEDILRRELYTTFRRKFSALRFPASWFYSLYRPESVQMIKEGLSIYPSVWGADRMAVQLFLLRDKLIYNPEMEFYAETGSESASKYMARGLASKFSLRMKYFECLLREMKNLPPQDFVSSMAYRTLCWNTAAYDTTFTFRNLIRRSPK